MSVVKKIFLLIYCRNLKKLFVQVQPKEHFLFLFGFLIFAVEGFVATIACAPDLCFTVTLFLRAIYFFIFPAFFILFIRGVLVSSVYALYHLNFFVCFSHTVMLTYHYLRFLPKITNIWFK